MKRLLAVLFAVAVALPVAADTQVVCSITAQAETACSAITVSQAGQFDQCRCNQNAPAPAGPFGGHATLTDSLVSYWSLDEVSGVRVDAVGTNDLTDNNTVLYANTGPSAVVASFAFGANEFLNDVPVAITLGDTDWTIAAWVKPTAAQVSEPIFSKGSGGTNSCLLWLTTNQAQLYTRNLNDVVSAPVGSAPNDKWTYVVAYHDAANNLIGISVDGGAFTTAATGAANSSNATALEIGGRTGSYFYDGNIARAAKWDRVLTAADALALYNAGSGKSYSDLTTAEKVGLVSYWNLDEASGNRADSHGSNTLTDNNTVTSVDNTHPGFGKAASFVGTSNESLQKDSFADPSSDWCFTFWGYANGPAAGSYGGLISLFDTGVSERMRVSFQETDQYLVLDNAASAGAQQPSRDAWHFYAIWETGGVTYISIDNAAATSTANVMSAGVDSLRFGFGTWYLTGRIAHGAYWSRVLTAQERTDLYAAGAGLFYED